MPLFLFLALYFFFFFFFFFQAEDGIRDPLVTGVQTCALPISCSSSRWICTACSPISVRLPLSRSTRCKRGCMAGNRSEERRVGNDRGGRGGGSDRRARQSRCAWR